MYKVCISRVIDWCWRYAEEVYYSCEAVEYAVNTAAQDENVRLVHVIDTDGRTYLVFSAGERVQPPNGIVSEWKMEDMYKLW